MLQHFAILHAEEIFHALQKAYKTETEKKSTLTFIHENKRTNRMQ